jgi:hypothetical protein
LFHNVKDKPSVKKFYLFIVKNYLKAFLPTFLIVMLILLMQVIWLYVDELIGKGLDWLIIAELIFYFSASLIPQALPLSILLASIMKGYALIFANFMIGGKYGWVASLFSGDANKLSNAILTLNYMIGKTN